MQQEWVDRNFLASTHAGTPDPRQACPPEGQRLLIGWKFPINLLNEELTLRLRVRFWDNQEEIVCRPLETRWGSAAFFFREKKILTYKIDVVNALGECVETWEHHFWTELIDLDRSNASVSSQPKQGSVIETP